MREPIPCTIVIPTRNHPAACGQMLETLLLEIAHSLMALRVVFLANDTVAGATGRLQEICSNTRFAALQIRILVATNDHPTAEENIRYTLGANLDCIDEHFLIVGNTDSVKLSALTDALKYMRQHCLDLLLVGLINREESNGKPVRQFYSTPRHLNPRNRLSAGNCVGRYIYADAMLDYGPVDYLAFIGCQIYTKAFFRQKCATEEIFPEPLYSHPMATLELTTQQDFAIGFFPEVVVLRVNDLDDPVNGPEKYRLERGFSSHIYLATLTNSLHLSMNAFQTLVNSQSVAVLGQSAQYIFSNFLFLLVFQMSCHVMHSSRNLKTRYSTAEQLDIVAFGQRLATVDIGLPAAQCALISAWLQHFSIIGNYSEPARINELLSGSSPVLTMLDSRPGMDRWTVQLV